MIFMGGRFMYGKTTHPPLRLTRTLPPGELPSEGAAPPYSGCCHREGGVGHHWWRNQGALTRTRGAREQRRVGPECLVRSGVWANHGQKSE